VCACISAGTTRISVSYWKWQILNFSKGRPKFYESDTSILLPMTSELLSMPFYSTNTRITTHAHLACDVENIVTHDSPAHLPLDMCPLFAYDTVPFSSVCKERLSFLVTATRVHCSSLVSRDANATLLTSTGGFCRLLDRFSFTGMLLCALWRWEGGWRCSSTHS